NKDAEQRLTNPDNVEHRQVCFGRSMLLLMLGWRIALPHLLCTLLSMTLQASSLGLYFGRTNAAKDTRSSCSKASRNMDFPLGCTATDIRFSDHRTKNLPWNKNLLVKLS